MGNTYLWQDEAETALLARSVLHQGYPNAWDGKNFVTQNAARDSSESGIWTWHPWLQFYLAAASFAVLGESTTAARLPFAVVGLVSVALFYFLARRLTENETIARIACTLFVSSVPFLLHARQARWYALAMTGSLWVLLAYLKLQRRERTAAVQVVLASTLLFHSNYLVFFTTGVGIVLHLLYCLLTDGERPSARSLGLVAGATFVLTTPWILLMNPPAQMAALQLNHTPFLGRVIPILERLVVYTNGYVFPLLLVPVIVWILVRRQVDPRDTSRSSVALLVLLALATYLVLIVQPWLWFRYMVGVLPVFAVLLALVVWEAWKRRRLVGVGLLGLFIFTNLPSAALPPFGIRFELMQYLFELTHDYDGPIEAIVEYLRRHGTTDDVVVTLYGDLPIMFYTQMRVVGFSDDLGGKKPDWIIPRQRGGPVVQDYLARMGSDYDRIELDTPDTRWENRPDPAIHRFRTARLGDPDGILPVIGKVVLFHRRGGSSRHDVAGHEDLFR